MADRILMEITYRITNPKTGYGINEDRFVILPYYLGNHEQREKTIAHLMEDYPAEDGYELCKVSEYPKYTYSRHWRWTNE